MNANKTKVVKYDPQGIIRSAAMYAPFLLKVDEEMVQKFFTAMAVEQTDGSLLLPESIRSFFAVEVVYEDVPVDDDNEDILEMFRSIYDSPTDESVLDDAEKVEIALSKIPVVGVEYLMPGYTTLFSDDTGEGNDSGEFELAVTDRIIVDKLSS